MRDRLGKPLIVRSAYRSPEHNRAVGGARRSKHMEGAAFDIAMTNHDPHAFEETARAVGFLGFGFYREPRNNFIHIDLGPKRTWGSRWPVLTPAFTPEPPAQKPLAKSRTMKGSGAAGVATVGAAGVEMIRDAATKTQAAVQPLIPYLDTLRWLFIAAALAGSRLRSTPAGTTGSGGGGDWRASRLGERDAVGPAPRPLGRGRPRHSSVPALDPPSRRTRRPDGRAPRSHGGHQ
ncbi:YcbK family protein [Thalassococcus profundi]|uniref:YcbK family protein n=1 Tax=Thalassococcus profundi TaxID=2282382 RepID=UPI0040580AC7